MKRTFLIVMVLLVGLLALTAEVKVAKLKKDVKQAVIKDELSSVTYSNTVVISGATLEAIEKMEKKMPDKIATVYTTSETYNKTEVDKALKVLLKKHRSETKKQMAAAVKAMEEIYRRSLNTQKAEMQKEIDALKKEIRQLKGS